MSQPFPTKAPPNSGVADSTIRRDIWTLLFALVISAPIIFLGCLFAWLSNETAGGLLGQVSEALIDTAVVVLFFLLIQVTYGLGVLRFLRRKGLVSFWYFMAAWLFPALIGKGADIVIFWPDVGLRGAVQFILACISLSIIAGVVWYRVVIAPQRSNFSSSGRAEA